MSTVKKIPPVRRPEKSRCGLCGKRKKLAKTGCCDKWICNDENTYVMFSYAKNSCARNHRRYTLCGAHDAEKHKGDWKSCTLCPKMFPAEMYDWYGSNEYNFEKLEFLLQFTPIGCGTCQIDKLLMKKIQKIHLISTIKKTFPEIQWRGEPSFYEGWDYTVAIFNDRYVVRIPKNKDAGKRAAVDFCLLQKLQGKLPVRIQKPILQNKALHVSVYEVVSGELMPDDRYRRLTLRQKNDFAKKSPLF